MSHPEYPLPRADGSVLDTPTQRRAEEWARKVAADPRMLAAVQRAERRYVDDEQYAGSATARATAAEAARCIGRAAVLYALTEARLGGFAWTVTLAHTLAGQETSNSGYGIENPDNVYRQVMLAPGAGYRVTGRVHGRGPHEVHFELRDSIPGTRELSAEGGALLGGVAVLPDEIGPGGTFEVTLGDVPVRAARHLDLPTDEPSLLLVRDLFVDGRAQPVELELEQVCGPAPGEAAPDVEALATRAADLLDVIVPFWQGYFDQFYLTHPVNEVRAARLRPAGRGMSSGARTRLAEDEALVITLDPQGARSLGVQASDPWGVAYEYRSRSSALSLHQVTPNPDGTITYVVCAQDPGVGNWIDTCGQSEAFLAFRWQVLTGEASPEAAVRGAEVVRLVDLPAHLPTGFPRVTAAERERELAERVRAFDQRFAPASC